MRTAVDVRIGAMRREGTGFTLLEMLLVVAILALLAALVGSRLVGAFGGAQVDATQAQLSQLASNVEQFRLDMSRYPTQEEGLRVLLEQPSGDADDKWDGPYLSKEALPKDAWNRDFIYQTDEKWGFRIISYGADGKAGGEKDDADIDNRS